MEQSQICEAARRFYERVFSEKFFEAAGEDMITTNLDVAIDDEIEQIVKNAGRRAGLELRNRRLGGSYAT
jgi:5-methylthioribose kinase